MTANKMGMPSNFGVELQGMRNLNMSYWNLTTSALVERIVSRREGFVAHEGAVVVRTGNHTGHAPNDKFIVCCQEDHDHIWWGKVNKRISSGKIRPALYLDDILLSRSGYFHPGHHSLRPPRLQAPDPRDH